MILEAIVTTLNAEGRLNIAPMGPEVEPGPIERFVLKPFQTSTTYRNLASTGEGVLHVSDDVRLIARAAIGPVEDARTTPATVVRGMVLASASRWYEFRVLSIDASHERTRIEAETVASGRGRDLFGLNRGKFAVVEAAILATRLAFVPADEVLARYHEWSILVEKTGGPEEREAFALLEAFVRGETGAG